MSLSTIAAAPSVGAAPGWLLWALGGGAVLLLLLVPVLVASIGWQRRSAHERRVEFDGRVAAAIARGNLPIPNDMTLGEYQRLVD